MVHQQLLYNHGLNRTKIGLKLRNPRNYSCIISERLNRTKIGLKLVLSKQNTGKYLSLNRTKIGLKSAFSGIGGAFSSSLNRTKIGLKFDHVFQDVNAELV